MEVGLDKLESPRELSVNVLDAEVVNDLGVPCRIYAGDANRYESDAGIATFRAARTTTESVPKAERVISCDVIIESSVNGLGLRFGGSPSPILPAFGAVVGLGGHGDN